VFSESQEVLTWTWTQTPKSDMMVAGRMHLLVEVENTKQVRYKNILQYNVLVPGEVRILDLPLKVFF
jgi:hypothetical protein